MSTAQRLLCQSPAEPPVLSVEAMAVPRPGKGEVVVRVEAAAVNPIDVKRAGGYGRRLLGLKGAGKFPLVLGNDIAGVVESVGTGGTTWRPGIVFSALFQRGRAVPTPPMWRSIHAGFVPSSTAGMPFRWQFSLTRSPPCGNRCAKRA